MKDYPHDWKEVVRYDDVKGFYCQRCELFLKYDSFKLSVESCLGSWLEERAKERDEASS